MLEGILRGFQFREHTGIQRGMPGQRLQISNIQPAADGSSAVDEAFAVTEKDKRISVPVHCARGGHLIRIHKMTMLIGSTGEIYEHRNAATLGNGVQPE